MINKYKIRLLTWVINRGRSIFAQSTEHIDYVKLNDARPKSNAIAVEDSRVHSNENEEVRGHTVVVSN